MHRVFKTWNIVIYQFKLIKKREASPRDSLGRAAESHMTQQSGIMRRKNFYLGNRNSRKCEEPKYLRGELKGRTKRDEKRRELGGKLSYKKNHREND